MPVVSVRRQTTPPCPAQSAAYLPALSDEGSRAPHQFSSAGSNPSNPSGRTTPDPWDQNAPSVLVDGAGNDLFVERLHFALPLRSGLLHKETCPERPPVGLKRATDYTDYD